jgi:hypothetical protein
MGGTKLQNCNLKRGEHGKHESKLQNSNLKEENMEAQKQITKFQSYRGEHGSTKANYKISILKRRTWKHKSKLQNSNLKEESTGSTGIIIYHSMISAKQHKS